MPGCSPSQCAQGFVPPIDQMLPRGEKLLAASAQFFDVGQVVAWDLSEALRPFVQIVRRDIEIAGLEVASDGRVIYSTHYNGSVLASLIGEPTVSQTLVSRGLGRSPRIGLSTSDSILAISDDAGRVRR